MFMRKTLLFLAVCGLLSGCTSYKKSQYLRHDEVLEAVKQYGMQYDYRVMPKDELTITVSTSDPEASASFYRRLGQSKNGGGSNAQGVSNAKLLDYLVDNNGCIDYPILGMLKVEGMTANELETEIANRIEGTYLKTRPVVTVRLSNYKISVLGEVTSPGTYTVPSEKISIYGALAMAKDLTIYGCRDNVKLIREDANGKKSIHELNLNDANLINSPYYYLQQNDVIYVTPNKTKSKNSDIGSSTSYWVSSISILVSIASLVTYILR